MPSPLMESESNKKRRWIKESVWLQKRGNKAMNQDEGGIYALQSQEHCLEPRRPDPLGGAVPPQRHHGGIPERGCRLHRQPFS